MGLFGATHEWRGWAKRTPFPKIYQTYATMMKLGAVIPYMKKIHKIYQSHDIPHELC